MTTKNLSKSFKGKINGQRLPPIPIVNEQATAAAAAAAAAATTTNGILPNSILKKSNPTSEEKPIDNHRLPLDYGRDS